VGACLRLNCVVRSVSTLPPMSGVAHRDEFGKSGLSKLRWEMADHERSLADKEVERSGVRGPGAALPAEGTPVGDKSIGSSQTERPIGNPDCFDDEDYTYDRCCDLTVRVALPHTGVQLRHAHSVCVRRLVRSGTRPAGVATGVSGENRLTQDPVVDLVLCDPCARVFWPAAARGQING
jgi:hypothetical protein